MEQFILCLLGFCGVVVLVKCIGVLYHHIIQLNKKTPTIAPHPPLLNRNHVIQLNKKTPTIRASQAHFYVARDKYNKLLYLYLGKPIKGIDRFHACHKGCIIAAANHLSDFGLNPKDFENIKFEDGPAEVFLDLK